MIYRFHRSSFYMGSFSVTKLPQLAAFSCSCLRNWWLHQGLGEWNIPTQCRYIVLFGLVPCRHDILKSTSLRPYTRFLGAPFYWLTHYVAWRSLTYFTRKARRATKSKWETVWAGDDGVGAIDSGFSRQRAEKLFGETDTCFVWEQGCEDGRKVFSTSSASPSRVSFFVM